MACTEYEITIMTIQADFTEIAKENIKANIKRQDMSDAIQGLA